MRCVAGLLNFSCLLLLHPRSHLAGINVIRIAPAKAIELTVFDSAKKALARPSAALSEKG